MRLFAVLVEELESRCDDGDRVAALARHLRAVGRDAGALAAGWLVVGARLARPARLTQRAVAAAAARLAQAQGMAPWLFEAGLDAGAETAEAIALLLPWPEPAAAPAPTLADWLAAWRAAAASPAADRADAVAATIAALDDAMTRRWAVRAVCGLAKPVVDAWQWQRAWALAFDEDAHALAWIWHRLGTLERAAAGAIFALRPRAFAPLPEADAPAHAGLLDAWRRGALQVEPRWRGERVQLVRHGDELAVWRRDGSLANAALPASWLAVDDWPDPCVIDGVLIARPGDAAVDAALDDTQASRHLVLVDWQVWGDEGSAGKGAVPPAPQRRVRLERIWPPIDVDTATGITARRLPRVFTTPTLALHDDAQAHGLPAIAARGHRAGWSGLVLRRHADALAWSVRAQPRRVRAVLQYVPSEALPAAAALAFVECGFALWSRAPVSELEQAEAMTASMRGEFLPPPVEAPELGALRLLPLARLRLALDDFELQQIHAWLRTHAGQRFGAVHAVAPALVFELGYARARASRRHKIGQVLERAHVLRWVRDAAAGAADRVADLAADKDRPPASRSARDADGGLS